MKKQTVWLVVVVLVGFLGWNPGPVQGQENLLVNGGLENGVVEPWHSYMVDLEVVTDLVGAAVPDVPYEGAYCLHATVATLPGNYWDRWVKPNDKDLVFESGKKYTFSAFMKSSHGVFRCKVKPERNGTGYGPVEIEITEEWQEFSVTTPVFDSTLEGCEVALLIGYQVGDIWIDNARFYEGEYVPPTPITQASHPSPEDGATDVTFNNALLSWKPGQNVVTHNVYLGQSLDAVSNGDTSVLAVQGLEGTAFRPGKLALGQTYYWRVDGVGSSPSAAHEGEVWSFTVEPVSRPVTGLTATASSSLDLDYYGPEKTIDGSGLTGDLHSTLDTDMWMSDAGLPAWIQFEFARPEMLEQMWIWNSNLGLEPWFKFGAQDVTIETSLDGVTWTALEGVEPLAQAPGLPGYAPNTMIDFGGTLAKYVKLTIASGYGQTPYVGLSEVRFYAIPVYARNPQPAAEMVTDDLDVVLAWSSGRQADSHMVLFSQDADTVLDGSAVIDTTAIGSLDLANLGLELDYGTTYYWQVVEVNDTETPSSYAGDVWSFLTPEAGIIDDMESYDDVVNFIWINWMDGVDDDTNGSVVGVDKNAPETEVVYQGYKAMPMEYDNSTALFSEVTRTFDPPLDLTKGSPESLCLYFCGAPDNDAQPIYLVLKDVLGSEKGVPQGNPEATLVLEYEQWVIPMSDLSGLDLAQIESMTIGAGDPDSAQPSGAKGKVYIDNIVVSTPYSD